MERTVGAEEGEDKEKMCDVCCALVPAKYFPVTNLTCQHRCCAECMETYVKERIMAGFVDIPCPWNGCEETYSPAVLANILGTSRWKTRYRRLSVTKALLNDPETRFCPGVDCDYAVFVPGDVHCPVITCRSPSCGVQFCCKCSELWDFEHVCKEEEQLPDTKRCPGCHVPVTKIDNGACNHMRCRFCRKSYCWLCLKEATSIEHFNIKCPLYGKRRYGKGRQMANRAAYLGEVVIGVPVVAGAVAGAVITASAVTTIAGAVSSPVFLARKLVKREKARESSTARQRLALTGGVALGAIGIPVLAPWGLYVMYRKISKSISRFMSEYTENDMQAALQERRRDRSRVTL